MGVTGKNIGKCTTCQFNNGNCTVGTYWAEQGLNKVCYQGELWKPKGVIGVITPYVHLFEQWKRDIGVQLYGNHAKYKQIKRIDGIRGCEFYKVETGYKYWEVDEDVYNAAVLRIR